MQPPDEIGRLHGVTRMPRSLRWFEVSDVLGHLPPDFKLESELVHVLFEVDIDETGKVTHAEGVSRPLPPSHVQSTVVEIGPDGQQRQVPDADEPPIALREAVAAAAYTMRFRPAERDGRPVPIHKLRLGTRYSRKDLNRSVNGPRDR
jgi:hypothetical protein